MKTNQGVKLYGLWGNIASTHAQTKNYYFNRMRPNKLTRMCKNQNIHLGVENALQQMTSDDKKLPNFVCYENNAIV